MLLKPNSTSQIPQTGLQHISHRIREKIKLPDPREMPAVDALHCRKTFFIAGKNAQNGNALHPCPMHLRGGILHTRCARIILV